jgi:hypothetical protein
VTPSTDPNRQAEWRNQILVAAGYDPRRDFTNEHHNAWWYNRINRSSLRLTKPGYLWCIKQARWQFHGIDLNRGVTGRQLLQLERLLDKPYFIMTYKRILVLDEATAIMLQLHAGDLGTYLDNLQANQ